MKNRAIAWGGGFLALVMIVVPIIFIVCDDSSSAEAKPVQQEDQSAGYVYGYIGSGFSWTSIRITEVNGHEYVIAQTADGVSIVHSASCPLEREELAE